MGPSCVNARKGICGESTEGLPAWAIAPSSICLSCGGASSGRDFTTGFDGTAGPRLMTCVCRWQLLAANTQIRSNNPRNLRQRPVRLRIPTVRVLFIAKHPSSA